MIFIAQNLVNNLEKTYSKYFNKRYKRKLISDIKVTVISDICFVHCIFLEKVLVGDHLTCRDVFVLLNRLQSFLPLLLF